MSNFIVYKRGKFFYARLKNPLTGKWTTAKSTRQESEQEAIYVAMGWLHNTLPKDKSFHKRSSDEFFHVDNLLYKIKDAPLTSDDAQKIIRHLKKVGFIESYKTKKQEQKTLVDFLTHFWEYEESPYIKERLAHGQKITKTHALNKAGNIDRYWKAYFSNKLLIDLTRQDLKDFSLWLSQRKKTKKVRHVEVELPERLAPETLNKILRSGTVALKWAALEKLIPEDPAKGLIFFSGESNSRGILTDKEVIRLFEKGVWTGSPANRLGNLTAMQTGLRMGEIISLKVKDILPDRIKICHSWSENDKLKKTKTNKDREVAILPELSVALLNHAKLNPNGYGPESFIFFHINFPDRPHAGKLMYMAFLRALESIGIDEKIRKDRDITFHSWRHYYARKMVDELDKRAATLTGHATPEMLEHYANHAYESDFRKAIEASTKVFGSMASLTNGEVCHG